MMQMDAKDENGRKYEREEKFVVAQGKQIEQNKNEMGGEGQHEVIGRVECWTSVTNQHSRSKQLIF